MKKNIILLSISVILISVLLIWVFLNRSDKPPILPSSLIQFDPEITHTFNPDSTLKKHVFRFRPKKSSDKYVVKIEFIDFNHNAETTLIELEPEVFISDYDNNSIEINNPISLNIIKMLQDPRLIIYSGYFSLSEEKHYRIDFTVMDSLITELNDKLSEVKYSVGILELE